MRSACSAAHSCRSTVWHLLLPGLPARCSAGTPFLHASPACPCPGRSSGSRRWMIDFGGRKGMQRMCADASFRARKRSTTVFISARRATAHCALAHTSRSRDSRRTVYVFVYVRAHAFVRA